MAHPYQVAIHLTAKNGVSSVLAAISKDVLGLEASVATLQKGFSNLRMGVIGAASALAGAGLLTVMGGLVDKGNAWVKISRDMAQAGASQTQILNAQAEALKLTARYANMSSVEIMKMQNDARMTFGSQDIATQHIKSYVEMASFLKAYEGHEKGAHDSESLMREINAAMKSGELAGKISPADMEEHIKQLVAMKVAYGEQVKVTQYLAAQRTGGVALRNTSDEFRYGMFPALVQEQGSRAGVMLMTAFNKVVAGVGNRTQSLEAMEKLGLLNSDQLQYDKAGRVKGLKDPDGIKGSREAAMNFGSWVMTTLKPLLDKSSGGDPIREAQLISKMFPDRNAAMAITEVLQQFTKLTKDAEQMARARKSMDMGEYNSGSWDYQVEAFQTQWQNLMVHLGAPMVAQATKMLAEINKVMTQLTQWVAANPEMAKTISATLAGVGAGLTAIGVVLIGGAILGALGPAGWLVVGIAGLGAALAAFKGDIDIFGKIGHWFTASMTEANGEAIGAKIGHWLVGSISKAFEAISNMDVKAVAGQVADIAKQIGTLWYSYVSGGVKFFAGIGVGLAKEVGEAIAAKMPIFPQILTAMQGFGASMKAAIFAFFDGIGAWAKEKLGSLFSHINYDGGGGGGGGGGIFNAAYHPGGGGLNLGGGGGAVMPGAIPHASSANVAGFQPVFKERMAAMMAAAKAAGVPLSVFSGYRSQAHQNALFAHSDGSGHMVARHSNHTRGIAADLRGNLGWAHAHAHEFGLKFPMPWEKWHIEPQESRGGARWHGHVKPYVKPQAPIHIKNEMVVDGEVLHRSVVKHERRATEHSHQAPTFDGYHDFSAPDGQIWAA